MAAALVATATAVRGQQAPAPAATSDDPPSAASALDKPALLNVPTTSLEAALARLYRTSGVPVSFSPSRLPRSLRVSCACAELTVRGALETLLRNTAFTFREVEDGYILIVDRPQATPAPDSPRPAARDTGRVPGFATAAPFRTDSAHPAPAPGTITGWVTGRDGRPLARARVLASGALGRAVETGPDGRFTITGVPPGPQLLRATYPGYVEARRTILVLADRAAQATIPLTQQVVELESVVAVGYGTARRRELAGAVGSVAADRANLGSVSVGQLLQGRIAGLNVTQNNGAPGGGVAIRLRGTSSISASSEPLYVIDGVPAFSAVRGSDANTNPLAAINPADIESIEVLKDASSTAIYGARGAPGVVLISTKRGRRGSDGISLESSYGVQSPARYLDLLDGPEFAAMVRDARANAGMPLISPLTGEAYSAAQFDSIARGGTGTDWQRLVMRTAPIQSHALTFSGGDDRTRYLVSGSVFEQDGIIIGSDFRRYSGRLNFDRILAPRLQVGTNLTFSQVDQNVEMTDNGLNSGAVASALWFNPLVGPRLPDGSWRGVSPVTWPAMNPVPALVDDRNWQTAFTAIGSAFGELALTPALRLRSSLGLASQLGRTEAYTPRTSPQPGTQAGRASVGSTKTMNLSHDHLLTYRRATPGKSLDLLAGATVQTSRSQELEAQNEQFANDLTGAWDLGAGTRPTSDSDFADWSLVSFLGRASYVASDRYLFTVTGRSDGSSRFGKNDKWGFFPSAALGWRIVEEPFMERQAVFDELKLRLSYGVTGNQEIGLYQSLPRLATTPATWGGVPLVGYAVNGAAPNPDLKWETTRQLNGGVDFAILGGRLSGAVDAYHSVTRDLLLAVRLPSTSGYATKLRNVGSVKNDGVELSLNTINYDAAPFQWTSSLTVAHNRNEVVDLGGAQSLPVANQKGINSQTGSDVLKLIVGQPLGTFVGKRTAGLYQQGEPCPLRVLRPTIDCVPGEYRYLDANGDGAIATTDNVVLGNGQPDLYGGLGNTLDIGPLQLNAFLQFSLGSEVLNAAAINTRQVNAFSNNTSDALRRWTPANTRTDVPRANAQRPRELYDLHVEDGSFLRLQTLSIAYDLPRRLIPAAHQARVHLTGQNVALWTRYSGYDPEVNSFGGDATAPGVDAGAYPRARTWTLGVNLAF